MKNDSIMKKNTFVKGAFITSFGVVLTKIMGILYVIPFHAIIGGSGGVLYGYAYTVYLFFLSLSTAGVPLAISRIVSEYQVMGYLKAKQRTFVWGKRIALVLGFVCFLVVMLTAPYVAHLILGDTVGGSSIRDVVLVIRVISFSLIIGPILSIYRGYFEGHRIMGVPSASQVLEQFIRVFIIIFGSLFAVKVLHMDMAFVVGIALSGATIGAFFSYTYLFKMYLSNRSVFREKIRNVNEPIILDKDLIKKIVFYSIPFIMIDVFKNLYSYVDMFTVVKGLVNYANYSVKDAEIIYSMFSTWAHKFNMILSAVSTGIVVSLIPHLSEAIIKKNRTEIGHKVNSAMGILLFFLLPMTLGISFLSTPIWTAFYGRSIYGPSVLSYYIFSGFVIALFTTTIAILLTLKDYKGVFLSLLLGICIKIIFNTFLVKSLSYIGFPPYYGYISATILGYFLSFMICIFILIHKYKISFESTLRRFVNILCGSIFMILCLSIIHYFFPVLTTSRITSIFLILVYSIIGSIIYFGYSYYSGLTREIFKRDSIIKWGISFVKNK